MELDAVVETPVETVVETPEVVETPDAVETPAEDTPIEKPEGEETPEATPTEEAETPAEEAPAEPITFDGLETPVLLEKITEVREKYEIPEELAAAFDALQAQVNKPVDTVAEFADYGTPDDVKTLLDRQSYLDSVRDESGSFRPNTDKFVQELHKQSADKASWLHYDLSQLPSDKYKGLNKFEEQIADALALEGDTVGDVLGRFNQTITTLRSGAVVSNDAPSHIPTELRDAYWSLSKDEREEYDLLAPDLDRIDYDENGRAVNQDEPIRQRKLATLAKIQKGIEGDKILQQTAQQAQIAKQEAFQSEVITTQTKFYDTIRETFTTEMLKNVKFSENPKMQKIMVHQNVALLTQAFTDDSAGATARQALADAGINFDHAKAQRLTKDVELASVALAQAKQVKGADGQPLNPVELNKANSQLRKTTEAWQSFAKDILDQEARLVSTGTAEAVKKEVEKIKVAPKARASSNGVGTPATRKAAEPPSNIAYGSPQWDAWFAKRTLEENQARESKRAQLYQTV